jgi:hypothetical protein
MLYFVIGLTVFLIFVLALNRKTYRKARIKTGIWAVDNGWQLIEFKSKWGTGPFREGLPKRGESYFQFTVTGKQGQKRTGWARYTTRLFTDWKPEIMWTDDPQS